MKVFRSMQLQGRRVIVLAMLSLALVISLSTAELATAQQAPETPCSWSIESTGRGKTNVFAPDTDSTYWLMSVDTTQWKQAILAGEYPQARFFSFVTYYQTLGAVDSIVDANISPDAGSENPFQPGYADGPHNYTVTIDGNTTDSGNHIHWGNTQTAYVIYRIYVPDKGLGRKADAPLPAVTFVDSNGGQHPAQSCVSRSPDVSLPTLAATTEDLASASSGTNPCPSGPPQPPQEVVPFVKPTQPGHHGFPNPATIYYAARCVFYEPGRVIVVRGQAAVFPNTYYGGSIFDPALPGEIQMRYWSMCNNDEMTNPPNPVVACKADYATRLDQQGDQFFYTYVVWPLEAPETSTVLPLLFPRDVTFLPWGEKTIPKDLLFREMLPMPGFNLTGSYLPTGVYCDKQLFIKEGWQGCFAAAGVPAE